MKESGEDMLSEPKVIYSAVPKNPRKFVGKGNCLSVIKNDKSRKNYGYFDRGEYMRGSYVEKLPENIYLNRMWFEGAGDTREPAPLTNR